MFHHLDKHASAFHLGIAITINSAGDAALYQKSTSTPSFKVNSTGDAKILENQKNFYKVVNNIQRNNLTASILAANSIKPKVDSQIPPNHPLYKPPKKGVRSVKDRVKNPATASCPLGSL